MPNIREWKNQGSLTRYPFSERSEMTSQKGVVIPDVFLSDASILSVQDEGPVYIRSLTLSGAGASGEIFQGTISLGKFTFTSETLANGGVASIEDDDGIPHGTLVAGIKAGETLSALPSGINIFDPSQLEFEVCCVFPVFKKSVRALRVGSKKYSGVIKLVEGKGIRILRESNSKVTFSAVGQLEGTLNQECCTELTPAIKTINGVAPNQFGQILLVPATFSEPTHPGQQKQILKITSMLHGIEVSLAI